MRVKIRMQDFDDLCDQLTEEGLAYDLERLGRTNKEKPSVWRFTVEGTIVGEVVFYPSGISVTVDIRKMAELLGD